MTLGVSWRLWGSGVRLTGRKQCLHARDDWCEPTLSINSYFGGSFMSLRAAVFSGIRLCGAGAVGVSVTAIRATMDCSIRAARGLRSLELAYLNARNASRNSMVSLGGLIDGTALEVEVTLTDLDQYRRLIVFLSEAEMHANMTGDDRLSNLVYQCYEDLMMLHARDHSSQ